MPRIARVVAPGLPHHVTQRGNRRQRTFFGVPDFESYVELMSVWCQRCEVAVWAYCLMPNHVHLALVPTSEEGLRRAVGEGHKRYTQRINARERWTGHLWQGRFASFVMDIPHLLAAVRYIELNPVRAGLCEHPGDYPWSSARAHLTDARDILVDAEAMRAIVDDWEEYLDSGLDDESADRIRRHERTGRPLGSSKFLDNLEEALGRDLRKKKPGPKPKN